MTTGLLQQPRVLFRGLVWVLTLWLLLGDGERLKQGSPSSFVRVADGWRTSIDSTWPWKMVAGRTRASIGDGWDYGTVSPQTANAFTSLTYNRNCAPTTEYAFSRRDGNRCSKIWTQYNIATNHPSPSWDTAFRYTFQQNRTVQLTLKYYFNYKPFCDLSDGIQVKLWRHDPASSTGGSASPQQLYTRDLACGVVVYEFPVMIFAQGSAVTATIHPRGADAYDTNYVDLVINDGTTDCDVRTNGSLRNTAIAFASWGTRDVTAIVERALNSNTGNNEVLRLAATTAVFGDPMPDVLKKLTIVLTNGRYTTTIEGENASLHQNPDFIARTCLRCLGNCSTGRYRRSIVYAQYGPMDVTHVVQERVSDDGVLQLTANNALFTDSLPNVRKTLIVVLNDGSVRRFEENTRVVLQLNANSLSVPTATGGQDADEGLSTTFIVAMVFFFLVCLLVVLAAFGWHCSRTRNRSANRNGADHGGGREREMQQQTTTVATERTDGAVLGVPMPLSNTEEHYPPPPAYEPHTSYGPPPTYDEVVGHPTK